jgi:hypothetical protein
VKQNGKTAFDSITLEYYTLFWQRRISLPLGGACVTSQIDPGDEYSKIAPSLKNKGHIKNSNNQNVKSNHAI